MIVKNINDEMEVRMLCDIATNACDLKRGDLYRKFKGSKAEKYSVPRTIVAVIARKDLKIHYNVIAEILKKDRSSIYHYERKHESDYASYPKYRNAFNKIFNTHSQMQENKKEFKDPQELIEHLHVRGARNCKNPTIKINISTDKYKVTIATNFKEFSNNYDICSEALRDYNCKIQIKA